MERPDGNPPLMSESPARPWRCTDPARALQTPGIQRSVLCCLTNILRSYSCFRSRYHLLKSHPGQEKCSFKPSTHVTLRPALEVFLILRVWAFWWLEMNNAFATRPLIARSAPGSVAAAGVTTVLLLGS